MTYNDYLSRSPFTVVSTFDTQLDISMNCAISLIRLKTCCKKYYTKTIKWPHLFWK